MFLSEGDGKKFKINTSQFRFSCYGIKNTPLNPRGGTRSAGSIKVLGVSYNFQTLTDTLRKNKENQIVFTEQPGGPLQPPWASSNATSCEELFLHPLPVSLPCFDL